MFRIDHLSKLKQELHWLTLTTFQISPNDIPDTGDDVSLIRRPQVEDQSGYSRSTIYLRISQGLFPTPVALGSRAVAWLRREVRAVNAARIAGKSDSDIRELVAKLVEARNVAHV